MPDFPGWDGDLDWWQSTVIYQIYPRSFKDSTGNGVGDLRGILSKLDYLEYIGIETIWLSPIYPSPMKDHGYDVSNYVDIEPLFGDLKDFDELVAEVHRRSMKLILDFIPNHSSDLHPWFIESRKGKDNPYSDFYVWHDGLLDEKDGTRKPPNNWTSKFGGSAWKWVEERGQFYFHQYCEEQPDLNWRNPAVHKEMLDVFGFWLDRGVDGFRIDTIGTLYETENVFQDNPRSFYKGVQPGEDAYLVPKYNRNQPETYEVTAEWRKFFDEYEKRTGRHHIYMVMELYDETLIHSMKYYGTGSDGPFNFNLVYLERSNLSGRKVHELVTSWLYAMPEGMWPNWVLGNHDRSRVASNVGSEYVDAMTLLLLLLPGTPTVYQGDEIGMRDVEVSWEQTQDPKALYYGEAGYKNNSRDPPRAPISWSAARNAGFTDGDSTWLPVDPGYETHNVEIQKSQEVSNLQVFRQAISLRRDPSFLRGSMEVLAVTDDLFAFARAHPDSRPYVVLLNVGQSTAACDVTGGTGLEGLEGRVVLRSCSAAERWELGASVDLSGVVVKPGDGLVIV